MSGADRGGDPTEPGTEQWAFETGGVVNISPTVVDGTVYVGSWDRNLYAVDAATGREEWACETGGKVLFMSRTSPTVVDGTVYFSGGDERLYAIDAATGEQEWDGVAGNSSPTVVDGTVYVGTWGNLSAVDAASGEQEWAFEIGDHIKSSPTVADGTVYVGSVDENLYAVEAASGEEEWAFETGNRVESSPTVADGTVYIGSNDGNLYAVDAASGREEWAFETGNGVESSPTVVDGTVYVGSIDGNLYAVAAASGREGLPASARLPVVEAPTEQVPAADAATSPPRRPDLSPDALGVVEEIGAGGQAIITEARLPEAQQPPETVALREPDTSATLTREAVETFLRQAETWAMVDAREREKRRWAGYEHIVGVVATGDRQPWLAMEYMDGGDLAELLAEHPDGLPVGQALWTGACVCKGLEIAHQLGRAHLDVKPRNVLLRETDGWPWPKLADWGLSRTLAEETGTMEGLSVQYAAPEQFDSTKFGDPDQLTDIYQTGALVYALLTGEPPTSGSQFEVMQQVMSEGSITPPSDRRAELPAAVDAAVGLALEREKTERYGSIGNFGDALHALRTGGRLPPAVAARLDE